MSNVFAFALLAVAVSLDSFSVGFTYGLRKMKIPLGSILIIAAMSATTFLLSMLIGGVLSHFLSPSFAARFGGCILIAMGIWISFQTFRSRNHEKEEVAEDKVIASFEVKAFGIAINILKKPMAADIDRSGTIVGMEAIFLGLALSFDSFGAGVGAAMLGYSPFLLAVFVGIMGATLLKMGMVFGHKLSYQLWINRLSLLPGILLILIGILKWK
ncbi:sporulation membrane protein YtaF [Bacillus testis]|uniref:sporulation membrane protein YtaF n=1 Tax=Bacillus testis TaxID=1622072 RepID=UPI00067E7C78|nr:sporulation membrane protein YtaF [Bacillus testis]